VSRGLICRICCDNNVIITIFVRNDLREGKREWRSYGGHLIAIDWGTSNFRAFRLDEAEKSLRDACFKRHSSRRRGALWKPRALLAQVGDWPTAGESRILLCGMVGSREEGSEASLPGGDRKFGRFCC
jgi:hypothetical protein